jgi:hypothetical protein
MRLWATTYGSIALLLFAAACDGTRDDVPDVRPCERAVAPLPPVDPQRAIRPDLEQYLAEYVEGGWGIGEGREGLSVLLPPGCGGLADRLESHYGNAIRVDRDVRIQPLR